MPADMQDEVAIVTGAGSGIGAATAEAFAERGARVVVADVNDDGARATVQRVEKAGAEAFAVHADVSKAADVAAIVQAALDEWGRLDHAFNNAGIEGEQALTHEQSPENWARVIDVNLKGVWQCMKYEVPAMLRNGGGAIVNCSSVAGMVGFENIGPYVASKHGVNGLTRTAALEYAEQGIRVNAVCPGVIDTPMVQRYSGGNEEAAAQLAATIPVGHIGHPREIADAVVWLCSDEASFVTGTIMPVDGGWTAR